VKLLLDTCTLLWAADAPEKLSRAARDALADSENTVMLSPICAWEIQLKSRRPGQLRLDRPAGAFVAEAIARLGLEEAPLGCQALTYLERLPDFHADPFDRALICQAIHEDCALVTPDLQIHRYPVRVLW
jgi:PIN domain nuclease of toxin-antitoxin system